MLPLCIKCTEMYVSAHTTYILTYTISYMSPPSVCAQRKYSSETEFNICVRVARVVRASLMCGVCIWIWAHTFQNPRARAGSRFYVAKIPRARGAQRVPHGIPLLVLYVRGCLLLSLYISVSLAAVSRCVCAIWFGVDFVTERNPSVCFKSTGGI